MDSDQLLLVAGGVACLLFLVLLCIVVIQSQRIKRLSDEVDELRGDVEDDLARLQSNQPAESLSKQDVVLLIHEEFERLAPQSPLATAAKQAISASSQVENVFYFSRPSAERMFDHDSRTSQPVEDTLYRFTLMRDDPQRAVVDLCPAPRALIFALDDAARRLGAACELCENTDIGASLRQTSAGVAVLKNGFWTMVRKVECAACAEV